MEALDCVMLAAGTSSRMDRWKMTLPFGEGTVIEASVRTALEACARVILVAGFRAQELFELFRDQQRVLPVTNERYAEGMFSSVRCGAAQVRSERFYLSLGDMPRVGAEVYRVLAGQPAVDAVIPKYRGKKGHPLLLSAAVAQAVLSREDGGGAAEPTLRGVLAELPTLTVPVNDPHVLHDLDTEEDYRALVNGSA
jgi:molybdenum cofactor cytidylyltransferase